MKKMGQEDKKEEEADEQKITKRRRKIEEEKKEKEKDKEEEDDESAEVKSQERVIHTQADFSHSNEYNSIQEKKPRQFGKNGGSGVDNEENCRFFLSWSGKRGKTVVGGTQEMGEK